MYVYTEVEQTSGKHCISEHDCMYVCKVCNECNYLNSHSKSFNCKLFMLIFYRHTRTYVSNVVLVFCLITSGFKSNRVCFYIFLTFLHDSFPVPNFHNPLGPITTKVILSSHDTLGLVPLLSPPRTLVKCWDIFDQKS